MNRGLNNQDTSPRGICKLLLAFYQTLGPFGDHEQLKLRSLKRELREKLYTFHLLQ